MKYSISTKTLYFISASSEKYSANLETLLRYLPSIGEMAFSCVIFIFSKNFLRNKNTQLVRLSNSFFNVFI